MKPLFRLLGATVAISLIITVALMTFSIVRSFFSSPDRHLNHNHIAVIPVTGMILTSQKFVRNLEAALENPGTKAIIVRINSPGGMVAPSEEMYEALKAAAVKIPVFVSMGSVAASGGYYLAMGAGEIYANAGTLTASIGVIMEMMNVEQLLKWAKVEQITLKAGKMKDTGSMHRPMKPEERELLDGILKNMHEQFRRAVQNSRKLSQEELDAVADGRVMTGEQAVSSKLIDGVKTYQQVVERVREKVPGLTPETPAILMEPPRGILKRWLMDDDSLDAEDLESSLKHLVRLISQNYSGNQAFTPGWRFMALAPIATNAR